MSAHSHGCNESLDVENDNLPVLATDQDKDKTCFSDEKCEELAFPKIFFKGKFCYTFPSEHYLTNYFDLRNFSQIFASNNYIFFAQSVLQ